MLKVISGKKHFRLHWDKANIAGYCDDTYKRLSHTAIDNYDDCHFSVTRTDDLSVQIVECLNETARLFVPRTSCSVFRHWWNASLELMP